MYVYRHKHTHTHMQTYTHMYTHIHTLPHIHTHTHPSYFYLSQQTRLALITTTHRVMIEIITHSPWEHVLHELEAGTLGHQNQASGQVHQPILAPLRGRHLWRPGHEREVPRLPVPGDKKWPTEPQDAPEGPLSQDVGEEKVDDGGSCLFTVGVDPWAFMHVVRGTGEENGGRKVWGRAGRWHWVGASPLWIKYKHNCPP